MKDSLIKDLLDLVLNSNIIAPFLNALFAAVFGVVTFKIYQRYKNKKDNNLIFTYIIKLKKELLNILGNMNTILVDYNHLKMLESEIFGDKELFKKLNCLNNYIEEVHEHDNKGNVIDCSYEYCDKPYSLISDLQYYINDLEENEPYDFELIKSYKKDLEKAEKSNLIDEIEELSIFINSYLIKCDRNKAGIDFIKKLLCNFNSKEKKLKTKLVNKLCHKLLDSDSPSSLMLKEYNSYKLLYGRFRKKNEFILVFEKWFDLDVELIALYESEKYLQLDEFYEEFRNRKISYDYSNINDLTDSFNFLNEKIYPIITNIETEIKLRIKKTNRWFKNI